MGARTVTLSIHDAAQEVPEQLAVVSDDAELTFAALAERARAVEAWLGARGATRNRTVPVAIVARADLPTIELVAALISLGIPIALLHPAFTDTERAALVARCGATLVVDPAERQWLGEPPAPAVAPVHEPDAEDILAIVFTSGTSGLPKGVKLSRRAFLAAAQASAANLGWLPEDRWLLCLPPAHIGGLSVVTRCLHARKTIVVSASGAGDVDALARVVLQHQVTLLSVVPTQLRRILQHADLEAWRSVRCALVGGAATPPELLEQARARGFAVLGTYGLTEACSQVATQSPGTVPGGAKPLSGVQVRCHDGIVEIRGPTLFSGYLPPHEADAPTPGDWFSTQDLGAIAADGSLTITGRRTDVIVSGGENVSPLEVEAALEHAAEVASACVFAMPDEHWGEIVCAALIANGTVPRDHAAALREGLDGRLARHKWPKKIAWLDALPLNEIGKVDRSEVRRRARDVLRDVIWH